MRVRVRLRLRLRVRVRALLLARVVVALLHRECRVEALRDIGEI